jgi:flavin reductase (DIM6/NTAB) family NADH-FMN oxidoreductase RutF
MTANSFTSVSLLPPLILVAVDHASRMVGYLRTAHHFGVNVLEQGQEALSAHFARIGHDRFAGVEWRPGKCGVPLIPGCLAHLECELRQMVEAGDHTIFIGEVLRAAWREGEPLLYFNGRYRQLHANAVKSLPTQTSSDKRA